ncbi:sulfotransferase family protein [Litoreibacter ponti]|uniref:sulfotransferase family protein n=1 Tax=Litoreibacter ponti TaxID=1510457 RepID=UPI001304AEC1|nr:sulfotransferase [Litoreibacter ponti]
MQVTSKEQTLKVLAMTRFHFITGLPRSGAGMMTRLLAQNPRILATSDGPAAALFAQTRGQIDRREGAHAHLEPGMGTALLRATLDAVHHARPMEAVVFDHSANWLGQIAPLAETFPLSRFIVMVRDPAAIAAEMAGEAGRALSPDVLLAPNGTLGAPLAQIHDALQSEAAERVLLVDRDRLLRDPVRVLTALYGFIREPVFPHDMAVLPAPDSADVPVSRRRAFPPLGFGRGRGRAETQAQVWRRLSASGATMLLPEAG